GYEVMAAFSGEEALEILRAETVDLILLDVNLPGMDGHQVCRHIREEEEEHTRSTPIVFLNGTYVEPADIARGLDCGGDDYLLKPVLSQMLLARVRAVLRSRGAERALARRNRELAALNTIAAAVGQSLHLDTVLEQALERTLEMLNFEAGGIYLEEGSQDEFVLQKHHGISSQSLAAISRLRVTNSLWKQAVAEGQPVFIPTNGCSHELENEPTLHQEGLKAVGCIPLKSGQRVLGLLIVASRHRETVGQGDREILIAIGHQIGVAVENARLYEEERLRCRQADTLREVSRILSTTLDLDELLRLVLDELTNVLRYDSAMVMLVREGYLRVVAVRGSDAEESLDSLAIPVDGEFLVCDVIARRESVLISDVQQSERWLPHPQFASDRSWIGAPLIVKGEAIGVLNIASCQPGEYDAEDSQMSFAFANQAAVAIHNARLFAETQQRIQELALLNAAGQAMASTLELDDLLLVIMRQAMEVLHIEAASILLLDETSGDLVFRAALGGGADDLKGRRLPQGMGIAGWVAQKDSPLIVPDVGQDMRFYPDFDLTSGFITYSILAVPLRARDRVIGVMEVINKLEGRFGADDRQLTESLAASAAAAIENARLYAEVAQAKEEWETTFNAITDCILIISPDLSIILANLTMAELLETTPQDLVGQDCRPLLWRYRDSDFESLADRSAWADKIRIDEVRAPRLGDRTFLRSIYPLWGAQDELTGMVLVLKDITAQKDLQTQLAQSARLAGIGELAAGVAHELSNPLTSILGFTDLLMQSNKLPESHREDLSIIMEEGRRAQEIVQGLLDFARQSPLQLAPVDLNQVIREVLRLLQRQAELATVVVEVQYATDLPWVMGDARQLKQVLFNLIVNALQAMPNGGTLAISSSYGPATARPGKFVRVRVSDTGVGIAPEHRQLLFQPFFTTKPEGKGTGLGLSVSLGIVENHGGMIEAESELGRGSCFTVLLPPRLPERTD
ncbi:MAG: GAF domain-containing protein, partial [Chloroflexota bacterium]|nr:GAF domain-containing protein [Chloroflexota bacterium]